MVNDDDFRLPKLKRGQWIKAYIIGSSIAILVLIGGLVYTNIQLHQIKDSVAATSQDVQNTDGDVKQTDNDVQQTDNDVNKICSALDGSPSLNVSC